MTRTPTSPLPMTLTLIQTRREAARSSQARRGRAATSYSGVSSSGGVTPTSQPGSEPQALNPTVVVGSTSSEGRPPAAGGRLCRGSVMQSLRSVSCPWAFTMGLPPLEDHGKEGVGTFSACCGAYGPARGAHTRRVACGSEGHGHGHGVVHSGLCIRTSSKQTYVSSNITPIGTPTSQHAPKLQNPSLHPLHGVVCSGPCARNRSMQVCG